MTAPRTKRSYYSVEEYLAIERATDERHVYLDGEIYAMAGESPEHGTISVNLVADLVAQLKRSDCQLWTKDCKVRSGPTPGEGRTTKGFYSYPDLVIVCGTPEWHDERQDVLLNPKVIIEVLSDSTKSFDANEKLRRYQLWNPTLTDYLLVAQTAPVVYHYTRQAAGGWSYYTYQGLHERFEIKAIGCTLSLQDVYDRISFPDEDEATDATEEKANRTKLEGFEQLLAKVPDVEPEENS
jgi:Uma2 family endonuclease